MNFWPVLTYGVFPLPDSYSETYSNTDSDSMQKCSTGPIPMVIPMDSSYENYLNPTLSVPISVPKWIQYPLELE